MANGTYPPSPFRGDYYAPNPHAPQPPPLHMPPPPPQHSNSLQQHSSYPRPDMYPNQPPPQHAHTNPQYYPPSPGYPPHPPHDPHYPPPPPMNHAHSQGPYIPPPHQSNTSSWDAAAAHPQSVHPPLPHSASAPYAHHHHPATPPPPGPPPLGSHPSIVTAPYPPPSYAMPQGPTPQRVLQTAEVKLEISAKGLRDRDLTSKSDPTCVVFLEERSHSPYGYPASPYADAPAPASRPVSQMRWREVGRTECIKNNLNPHFKVQTRVPYHFEELQHIRLGLWDIDSKKADLSRHDFLGDVITTLGELVSARVWTSKLSSPNEKDTKTILGTKRDLGSITVIVHEDRDGGMVLIKASLSAQKLDRKDKLVMSSDPYFILTQVGASSPKSRSQLYKSEVITRNINPVWIPFQVKAAIPKGGGKQDLMLEFLVYDKDRHKKDDEIGVATCSVAHLESCSTLPVINERRRRRRRYRNSGTLEFNTFTAIAMPSLVDYLQGGLKLHFSVAVDLTVSNGNPADPASLHYRPDMYTGNCYTRALTAVSNVLRVYTPSDNLFAAFGFGAELPGRHGYSSSCFPLGLGPDPRCVGIEGILQAYSTALNSVKLSGPTNFAPLIDTVSKMAAQRPNTPLDQNYDVLLILTDGVVSDFDLTVERIIAASKKVPLSIIIIGIGRRNFRRMNELDSDDKLLTSADGNRQAARDICQFVAFQDFEHAPPERLGAAVLAELPGNIVEYFVGACEPPIMPGERPVIPPMSY